MNIPKIRFKEFRNEWHSCKIDDFCKILMCKRIFANETSQDYEIPFYKIGTIGGTPDTFISKKLFDIYKIKYNYPKKGELLVTCSGTVGKCIIFDGKDSYYQDSNIVWLDNLTLKVSNRFLYYLLSRVDWSKLNSTTITRIYSNDLKQLKINYPEKEEQNKITNLLELLDKKIELQTKKIEALKLFKKGLISKLLNEYDYKIMKIKDVLKFEQPTKYIVNSDDYINDSKAIPVLTANKAFILGYCNENNFYDKGDSIIFDDFTMDMKYTNFNYKVKSSAIKILTAKGNNDLRFLYELLLSLNLKSEEHKRHYISIVQELDVKIPSVEVQKSISSKLELVDNKILFEEKFLNNLTKLKKGFMQSMFV